MVVPFSIRVANDGTCPCNDYVEVVANGAESINKGGCAWCDSYC